MNPRRLPLFALSMLCAAAPAVSSANTVILTRDSVVPIVFDSPLTVSDSRVGDEFTCHVDADPDLPMGTKFEGRIVSIRYARPDRPAAMDLEFTAIDLPGGFSTKIHAVPIPLNKDLVRTDANGRLYVKSDVRKSGEYVLGGALGGYLLGSLFHRRITGLFLGTVVGMVAANADRERSQNMVVDRGTKMGALFNQDVTVDLTGAGVPGDRAIGTQDRPGVSTPAVPTGGRGWDSGGSHPAPAAPRTAPANPGPPADISIRYDGRTLTFDADKAPYYQGESVMVPVQAMADALGVTFETGDNNAVYVENQDNSLKLEQDSVNYRLNGIKSTLSHPTVQKNNILYAPVEVFSVFAQKDLFVNGRKLDSKSDGG